MAKLGEFYAAIPGQPILFDASGSYDPDSTITSYAWDFDNDMVADAVTSEPQVSHT